MSQSEVCEVQINYKSLQLTCNFFAVPGNGSALSGMPHIELLDILGIKCNTINVQTCREIDAQVKEKGLTYIVKSKSQPSVITKITLKITSPQAQKEEKVKRVTA